MRGRGLRGARELRGGRGRGGKGCIPLRGGEIHFGGDQLRGKRTEKATREDCSFPQLEVNFMTNFESRISRGVGFRKGFRESDYQRLNKKEKDIRKGKESRREKEELRRWEKEGGEEARKRGERRAGSGHTSILIRDILQVLHIM